MVKYVKTLPGRPFVKPCELTEGFTPGVGYFRNLLASNPAWAMCFVFVGIGTLGIGIHYFKERNVHPDFREMTHESYKVRRIEDVDDPTRECYN